MASLFGLPIQTADDIGRVLMYVGFVFGAIALLSSSASAYLLYHTSNAAQNDARQQIEAARAAVARANLDAAQANERAANTEARIAPRRITQQQSEAIGRELTVLSGRTVLVESYGLDVEGAVLGYQIGDALRRAGITPVMNLLSYAGLGNVSLGVFVGGDDPQLVQQIVRSLTSAGIAVSTGQPAAGTGMSLGPPAIQALGARIFVGVKPIDGGI